MRRFVRRRAVRIAGLVLASIIGAFVVSAFTFHAICNGEEDAKPAYDRPELAALREKYPGYQRTEESTYLTLLEWYQVFSYQEYADWVATEKPSAFPYFAAIGQSWSMYCLAYGMTEENYPFNAGNHLMLSVIGTSFSLEYGLKGVYEKTSGRITELDAYDTPEDRYAAQTARDYADLIPFEPWYVYPFGERTVGLWQETDLVGHDMWRKWERKVFLTTENGVKAGYAFLIGAATRSIYGAPPAEDYVWARNVSEEMLALEGVRVAETIAPGEHILVIGHYQPFTDLVPQLARGGAEFVDIAGNDAIVMTVLTPREWNASVPHAQTLHTLDVLTDPARKRVVLEVPVVELSSVIRELDRQGVETEHIFDY